MKGVSVPIQSRSQKTLQNILDAAERLLNEYTWLEIGIGDVVAESGTSVGSFYARFKDKDTLLGYLSERLSNETTDGVQSFILEVRSLPLEDTVRAVVQRLVEVHIEKAGLIRTLTLLPRIYSDPLFPEDGLQSATAFKALSGLFARHKIPKAQASMAMFVIVTSIRERILFPGHSNPLISLSNKRFIDELCAVVLGYLGVRR